MGLMPATEMLQSGAGSCSAVALAIAVIVFFGKGLRKRRSRRHRCGCCQRIRFACQDHPDATLRELSQEAFPATAGDQNIEAVEWMCRIAGVLVDAHVLRQIELSSLNNTAIRGFEDHETARFSCVRGNGAKILARDANLHACDLFGGSFAKRRHA